MILVTGATGNVGAELVRLSVAAGEPVRALVRDEQRSLPDGVDRAVGDLNEPGSVAAALTGVTGMFLLPGYADMPRLLALGRGAGVERVVLLSGGAAVASDLDNAISRYMLVSEDAVRTSGLAGTILQPYAFMSNTLRWLPQLQTGDLITAPFADVATAVIDPYDIARVAAAALASSEHAGKTYRLSGPESLLPAEQVRILGEAIDRPLRLQAQSNDEARAEMIAHMPAEYVEAFFSFSVDGTLDESRVLPTVEVVTGTRPRTFRQWTETHAHAFR